MEHKAENPMLNTIVIMVGGDRIISDDADVISSLSNALKDVTDLKQVKNIFSIALSELEDQIHSATHFSELASFWVYESGEVVYINPASIAVIIFKGMKEIIEFIRESMLEYGLNLSLAEYQELSKVK